MTSNALARLPAPQGRALPVPPRPGAGPAQLTRRQKAAIIVQFIVKEGGDVALSSLPADLQETLTRQMGVMRYVDRATLNTVVEEFTEELEGVGLTFGGGMGGTLNQLEGKISPQTARRLRKEAGVRQSGDPWDRLRELDPAVLAPMIEGEATEIAAVILSKLPVDKAAQLVALLPGEQARRIAFAVSHTTKVTPDAVDRIGLSLAAQIDARPDVAFDVPPDQRVGAILNVSRNTTREDVLAGLEEDSEEFAKAVRKAIFTFANIAERVQTIDVPQVIRAVDQATLVRAMASARATSDEEGASVDFLLDNMSKRMGDMLRDETDAVSGLSEEAGEDAKTEVVSAIREMAESGEITLEVPQG